MKVWIAKWDIRNGGNGVEIYANRELAVDAAIAYAKENTLLGRESMREDEWRMCLAATGSLEFEVSECYYAIEEHDVRTMFG